MVKFLYPKTEKTKAVNKVNHVFLDAKMYGGLRVKS